MKTNDIQQAVAGFKTVAVVGGPMVVRVHEALDASYSNTPHRYFISVDFKFREIDALHIGTIGCYGCTKAEANREASQLAARITSACAALNGAEALPDTATNRITVKLQADRLNKITSRYCAEFVQS